MGNSRMHERNVENQRLRKILEGKEEELQNRRKALGMPQQTTSRPGSALKRPGSARPGTAEAAAGAILGLAAESLGEVELRARNAALRAEIDQAKHLLMGLR